MVKRKVYFTLDCAKPGNQYTVEGLHVGDKRSCEFHILLRNGIVPLSFDDENIAVIMNAQKPDGTTISTLCDISEDKKEVVYTLDVQDTTVAGIVNYELIIAAYDGENYCVLYSATFSTVVSTGVIVPVFKKLDSEPDDWATGYKKYFRHTQNGYEKITDDTCPTFNSNDFYFLVNPNYDSENDYSAFEQTVANVQSLLLRVGAVEAKNAEQDTTIEGKAAANHTHSEYVTDADISGKEDKANKVASNMASIDGNANMTKYPSVYAVREYLSNYFYSRSEIDRSTYTKDEVDTALGGKADIADIPFATPEQYGAKGDGVTDDTAAINACLAENKMVLFSGIYLVNPTANQLENTNYRYGISVPSNRIIFFEKNAELICKETGENYYYTVLLHEASNVLIDGMTLHGNRATEQSITSPRATCHGLEILGCENIQIKNTSVDKFIGDGLGVWVSGSEGTEGEYTICRDIEMSNCAVFENRRNGITIGGVEGFRAVACKIYNNGTPVDYGGEDSGSAQPPQAGVDIEPNYSHVPVKNLTFEDCLFYGNGGFDFINQNGTQERLSLINCDCLGGDGLYQGNVGALFRASSVIVTGGHYRRIGIGSNVTAAVISGAYINEILSAVTKKGVAFFDSCIIDGLLNSGGAAGTIKTNSENNMAAICELKNCTIKNCLPNTGYSLGTISLEGCYVEQPEGQWLNNGHLDAKNTKFHFENNTTVNVIWAKTNEFINCDFYYKEGKNYFIHTDDSATSKLWYNNRFYNDIYTLSPKANRLIKNWFNFASNKISGTATGEQIGNIFTDKKGITAYEIAVENGYSGTESQWLASLKGADGFSPTATVTQTASGATVSITDSTGTTTANISNGADGQDYVLTSQDKTDIANIVLQLLPTTQGVLYGNTSN